jgi:tetratricopeptide (TPR) repeat protein
MSSTTSGADSRARLDVELEDGRTEPLERVGPSVWGGVYRSAGGRRYYRLIPSTEGVTAEMRDELRRWADRPRQPGVAPIVHVGQQSIEGGWWLLVRYDVHAGTTLLEELERDDPAARTRAVAATFRALPRWWGRLGVGLLPMPSDVLFHDAVPVLLALPHWGIPDVEALFDEPGRARYLPPEIVSGRAGEAWANTSDLHALGVALLECFVRLPDDDAGRILAHIASGTAFAPERCQSRLAFWLQKIAAVRAAEETARRLVHPDPRVRSAVDPAALADELDACVEAMDPVTAVSGVWDAGDPRQAMSLAQAILVDEPSYELYVLAARVAWRGLRNSLEALSLLEKAIEIDEGRPDAYAEQVALIGSVKTDILAQLEAAIDPSFAARLDGTMRNAFDRLPDEEQAAAELDAARYLIDRGHFAEASRFVYGRLYDDDHKLHWWKFGLMLAYAEAFLGLDRLDECGAVLAEVKAGLAKVTANPLLREDHAHVHGGRLAELTLSLHERRKELSSA